MNIFTLIYDSLGLPDLAGNISAKAYNGPGQAKQQLSLDSSATLSALGKKFAAFFYVAHNIYKL